MSRSTCWPGDRRDRHDVGEIAPVADTASSCSATCCRDTRSVLVTIPITGVRARLLGQFGGDPAIAGTDLLVGRQAEPDDVDVATTRSGPGRRAARRAGCAAGACPGVSTMTSWASGRVTIPRTARRVVCGLSEVIAIFSPTMALSRVDLPGVRPADEAGESGAVRVDAASVRLSASRHAGVR